MISLWKKYKLILYIQTASEPSSAVSDTKKQVECKARNTLGRKSCFLTKNDLMMEKYNQEWDVVAKSFTVMTFRYFHAQRLNEYCSPDWVIVSSSLCGNLKMLNLDHIPLLHREVCILFKIKVHVQCPLFPKYIWLCPFMWLVTNIDSEINISFNDIWQRVLLAPTITL